MVKNNAGHIILSIVFSLIVFQLAACAGELPPQRAQQNQTNTTATPTPSTKQATPQPTKTAESKDPDISLHLSPRKATPSPTPTPTPIVVPTPTATPTPIPPTPISQQPIGGTGTAQPTSVELQLMQQLFTLINQDRANAGLPPYTWNSILVGTAYQHSIAMTQCGVAHACTGEPEPCERIANAGVNVSYCAENVGEAAPTPTAWDGVKQMEAAMLGEPPTGWHRINLLSTNHHSLGVGIRVDQNGNIWITEDFIP